MPTSTSPRIVYPTIKVSPKSYSSDKYLNIMKVKQIYRKRSLCQILPIWVYILLLLPLRTANFTRINGAWDCYTSYKKWYLLSFSSISFLITRVYAFMHIIQVTGGLKIISDWKTKTKLTTITTYYNPRVSSISCTGRHYWVARSYW